MTDYDLINQAIKNINTKSTYLGMAIKSRRIEIDDTELKYAEREMDIMKLTLDALKFYKENGIGNNIDENI